ncbi:MAG TPA: sn-glycerol-3-phosphate ABC transporter ATP-binding protein UgpC [Candidatus Eremiobacteraeota bacterium]|nr:sn-glycerol-3-phosphate ABC transporter ATP-binding protein UgpC [Candidatus Eremiobacteraeota bacterium]
MAGVILKDVWKIYKGNVEVVKNVSIEIKDKEFLVLVGPSGCGKTTALRMIAGLEDITRGEIYIGDRKVNGVSPKDRDIAMVFQNYALYPHMNVYDNMAFGLKLRKNSKEVIEKRVQEAAELLGISHLLKRKPAELSGGQRQRVAMGRAIVREPQVFLMDEPLSNLDAKLRVQMRAELQKLHQRLGITTIYVTHDQTEAMTLGDRIVVFNGGVIQQADTPLEIYKKPANKFVAGFIGSPAMNFFDLKLVAKDSNLYLEGDKFQLRIPGEFSSQLESYINKEVIFGMRPEDIYDWEFARDPYEDASAIASVDVTEPMGSEIYVYLSIGKYSANARIDASSSVKVGKEIKIFFDMNKMHLFDKDIDKSLLVREA